MITIKNLKKSYKENQVLKGVNLHVNQGDVYGFIGENGAGKSTTMNIMTDLMDLDDGQIHIAEHVKIGYLPESPRFYDYMSANEYLSFLGQLKGDTKKEIMRKSSELLSLVNLSDHAKKPIKFYSRGMQQRFGIASVLYNDPDLLLLDEPSSALDPKGRKDILDLILKLKEQGKTIFLSTHILSDLEKVCNRVGFLSQGEIVLESSMKDLLAGQDQYEIILQNQDNVSDIIRSISCVIDVNFSQDKYIITTDSDSQTLLNALVTQPLHIESYIKLKPTLEDIFMKVVNTCQPI